MPYTEQDLTDIETAIRKLQSGERVASVAYDGKTVSYSQVQLGKGREGEAKKVLPVKARLLKRDR